MPSGYVMWYWIPSMPEPPVLSVAVAVRPTDPVVTLVPVVGAVTVAAVGAVVSTTQM